MSDKYDPDFQHRFDNRPLLEKQKDRKMEGSDKPENPTDAIDPSKSDMEKAQAKLDHWQHTKKEAAHIVEPSPVTVGDIQKESIQYHSRHTGPNAGSERDKNPFQPDPIRQQLFNGGEPQRLGGLDINKGIRYDPIEYSPTDPMELRPITGGNFRQAEHHSPQAFAPRTLPQERVDPLNFSRTGFTDDPSHPSVDVRRLVGPDGTQDTLRGAELKDRIMMGDTPFHRGPGGLPRNFF